MMFLPTAHLILKPYRLALQIQDSPDFNRLLFSNYIAYSNGISMKAYAQKEMEMLSQGTYGVEDYHMKVEAYLVYLQEFID